MSKPKPKRPKHVDVTLSADAHENLTEMGKPASLRAYCAHILEAHAKRENPKP